MNTEQIKPSEVSDILLSELQQTDLTAQFAEVGTVLQVSDGVVRIFGLQNAEANELLEFEDGMKAVVMNLEEDHVGAVLLGSSERIEEGDLVRRTGRTASIRVSEAMLGRVIDPLGEPLDGKGPIDGDLTEMPLERKAPGVIFRQPVNQPLQTGLKAVDAMIPIGRGQRELIIGDRQTGKTAIAIDTIINQRRNFEAGDPIYCIYVAIGQKASTVAALVETLRRHGAMDYTVVVAATAADSAAMQYFAPFAGAAIGEYFRDTGRHALVVYDDLSKQAVAYREVSLVLRRPSGREAYPGDIFYLHSRLLERAAKIIDQQEVAAEMNDLPESLKDKVRGTLKIDQAQYRELEAFLKFSSDMDAVTAAVLDKGRKNTRLLVQPQYSPMPVEQQIAVLYCGTHGLMRDVPLERVADFERELLRELETSEVFETLRGGVIDEATGAAIESAAARVSSNLKA